jgi:acyl carrier protein
MKILGHRIEAGEVESALRVHESIQQTCVVSETTEDGSTRLVAYYVSCDPGPTALELQKFLAERLPQHSIPELFIRANSFPLTLDGQIDRTALPAPSIAARNDRTVGTTTAQLEQVVIAVWRRFLGTDRIGLADNFFDLGGDSLLLGRVQMSLQKELQIKLPITALFEFTTVRSLVHYLDGQISPKPFISDSQQRAQRQRAAFARQRERRPDGRS